MTGRGDTYAAVLEHVARYFDACDRCDLDGVVAILDGATVTAGDASTNDPAQVRALYAARQPAPAPDGRRATKHHATNLVLTGPDDTGAYVAAVYYVRLQPGDGGPVVAASGRLEQTLLPDGDGWRVLRHAVVSDF